MQKAQPNPTEVTTENESQASRCYTVEDLMDILGVGRKSVYTLIREKAFPAICIGKQGYRIPKDSFYSWLYQK